jgi:NADH-quinone oxidoreductase subunit I
LNLASESRIMRPDDPAIKWVQEPVLGLAGRMYLTPLIDGLVTTARHFAKAVSGEVLTRQFPEERPAFGNPLIYRGVHRLNKDEQGRVKCVACFLCSTACPAHCIDIVGAEAPWSDREKYPKSFVIDELRCIYCGMCEEACPVDAIELTSLFDLTGASREEMIFDKEKLLSVYDMTAAEEPMRSKAALLPNSPAERKDALV